MAAWGAWQLVTLRGGDDSELHFVHANGMVTYFNSSCTGWFDVCDGEGNFTQYSTDRLGPRALTPVVAGVGAAGRRLERVNGVVKAAFRANATLRAGETRTHGKWTLRVAADGNSLDMQHQDNAKDRRLAQLDGRSAEIRYVIEGCVVSRFTLANNAKARCES